MTAYVYSSDSVSFVAGGKTYSVDATHPNFAFILRNLADPDSTLTVEELVDLASPIKAVARALAAVSERDEWINHAPRGKVEVTLNGVTFNGNPVGGVLVDRILQLVHMGLNVEPWIEFATNLFQNPSFIARQELYLWLETSKLPLTPDGHFLAYKKVKENYHDIYSGSLDYSPGKVVTMSRHLVDDDRNRTCSDGLHFCSESYLPGFGAGSGDRVVLVKINPADVVAIPSDYNNAKGRAWRIEVLEDVTDTHLNVVWRPVASSYSDNLDQDDDYSYNDDVGYDDDYCSACGGPCEA